MSSIDRLLEIMAQLRDPDKGCPWDQQQTFRSIVPHTVEEAYEVADVIERDALDELADELGDLLFQIVFYAQIAKEEGRFEFADVVNRICEKLERRHPHVFSDAIINDADEQSRHWDMLKAKERKNHAGTQALSILDGIAHNLPAQRNRF